MTMKTNPLPTSDEIKTWFSQSHVTITFKTESGSSYTLVRRPTVIILIKDTTGQVWSAEDVQVVGTSIHLRTLQSGAIWQTTGVTHFYVATN